jgi:hypothetical protein
MEALRNKGLIFIPRILFRIMLSIFVKHICNFNKFILYISAKVSEAKGVIDKFKI